MTARHRWRKAEVAWLALLFLTAVAIAAANGNHPGGGHAAKADGHSGGGHHGNGGGHGSHSIKDVEEQIKTLEAKKTQMLKHLHRERGPNMTTSDGGITQQAREKAPHRYSSVQCIGASQALNTPSMKQATMTVSALCEWKLVTYLGDIRYLLGCLVSSEALRAA